jgi:hypothetical protein
MARKRKSIKMNTYKLNGSSTLLTCRYSSQNPSKDFDYYHVKPKFSFVRTTLKSREITINGRVIKPMPLEGVFRCRQTGEEVILQIKPREEKRVT